MSVARFSEGMDTIMADGLNKVTLIGNLGKDPVYRVTANNRSVAEFSMATSESWKNDDGNRQTHTEWHKIVVWGPAANAVRDHLTKGSKVYVEGGLRTRKWTDKEGKDHWTTEVQSSRVLFLSGRASDNQGASPEGNTNTNDDDFDYGSGSGAPVPDDDIPF